KDFKRVRVLDLIARRNTHAVNVHMLWKARDPTHRLCDVFSGEVEDVVIDCFCAFFISAETNEGEFFRGNSTWIDLRHAKGLLVGFQAKHTVECCYTEFCCVVSSSANVGVFSCNGTNVD